MKGRFLIAAAMVLSALGSAAAQTPAAKPMSKHEAFLARLQECSKEWKADKSAGKVPAGMKWSKYWSACNIRLKAART